MLPLSHPSKCNKFCFSVLLRQFYENPSAADYTYVNLIKSNYKRVRWKFNATVQGTRCIASYKVIPHRRLQSILCVGLPRHTTPDWLPPPLGTHYTAVWVIWNNQQISICPLGMLECLKRFDLSITFSFFFHLLFVGMGTFVVAYHTSFVATFSIHSTQVFWPSAHEYLVSSY